MTRSRARVLWVAGTRADVLRLGPYALHFQSVDAPQARIHWFAMTGEQGMAAYQALDDCGLRPDAEAELRHPAEDPAVRLQGLIGEVEGLARRFRATHLVFAGCGPTAVAAALVCHGRGLRGIWLRPHDPAGLIGRLRWERGLLSIIEAMNECVLGLEARPVAATGQEGETEAVEPPSGRRPGLPLVIVALTRPGWGSSDLPERAVSSLARVAAATPGVDWLFLRTLDARFEGPFNALAPRPPNLLTTPPVPYGLYAGWLTQAGRVVTDSWAVAAEALHLGIPVVALAEQVAGAEADLPLLTALGDSDIGAARGEQVLLQPLHAPPGPGRHPSMWAFDPALRDRLDAALAGS